MASGGSRRWKVQSYLEQRDGKWPREGKHVLAQYDDDSVVVYQAYCPEIAQYAVEHQKFGGERFSYGRMSWIKTNFLWMMYRCGWCTKEGQERVLAVRITREGFNTILSKALTGKQEKERGMQEKSSVRLQWDPDHDPTGASESRRAIQLGLRNEMLERYGSEWIVEIQDITDFVSEQYEHVKLGQMSALQVAEERVFPVSDGTTALQLGLSECDS